MRRLALLLLLALPASASTAYFERDGQVGGCGAPYKLLTTSGSTSSVPLQDTCSGGQLITLFTATGHPGLTSWNGTITANVVVPIACSNGTNNLTVNAYRYNSSCVLQETRLLGTQSCAAGSATFSNSVTWTGPVSVSDLFAIDIVFDDPNCDFDSMQIELNGVSDTVVAPWTESGGGAGTPATLPAGWTRLRLHPKGGSQ